MRSSCLFAVLALLPVHGFAWEWSAEWALRTEWIDRGISQTAGNPAVQAGIELAAPAGVYFGLWGSNVDFGDCCDETVQLDWTLGIAGTVQEIGWDAGLTWSSFPGASPDIDFVEYHLALEWRNLGIAAYWTPDFADLGEEVWYFELGAGFDLPWQEARLLLHLGYTDGNALHERFVDETGLRTYWDWQLALARDFGPVTAMLGWTDTDLGGDFRVRDSAERNDGRLFLKLAGSF